MRRGTLALGAAALDRVFGDPAFLSHPVIWMGRYITAFEEAVRPRLPQTESGEIAGGALLALSLPALVYGTSRAALRAAERLHPAAGTVLALLWGAQSLAARGLAQESERVRAALKADDLAAAREAVGRIVGRDTERLDAEGVAKAAVETVAENFSDGVAAPMLYLLLGGAPLALTYKAINTMDSMVGYRNRRYQYFGKCAARLDDLANLIPSRLAALCLLGAAAWDGQDANCALRVWRRDARKHVSPNAGQTESVCAGALGVQLGGEAWYFGERHEKATLGDALRPCAPEDIETANRLMYRAEALLLLCALLLGGARHLK